MKAPFPSLVGLLVKTAFGIKPLREILGGGRKAILKAVGFALLFVLVAADIGVIFVALNLTMYDALKPQGMEQLLLLNSAISASLIVFLLGLLTALSTYALSSSGESVLLALPIRPRELFAAKIIVVYLAELLLGAFLIGVSLLIFGIKEGPAFAFYLKGILAMATLPLVPLAIVYLVLVPLMSLSRFLKNKNTIMVVGGFIGVVFALLFNGLTQGALARMNDPAWIYANYAGPDSILALIGSAWPPALLAWRSITTPGLAGLGWGLANLALGLAAIGALAWILGPAYARSVIDFNENSLRKLKRGEARSWIARTSRSRPLMLSLLLREIRLMNREPMYLLNGPGIIILMPVIMVVALLFQGDALAQLGTVAAMLGEGPGGMLVAAAFGAFLGCSTSITCTALSRDAKLLPAIKALPVPARSYMIAKLLHGLVFALFGALVGAIGLGIFFKIGLAKAAGAFLIALSFSSLVNLAGLMLDTAMPRLSWDNPITALKQNPNAVIAILGAMGLIGLLGWLSTRLALDAAGFVLLLGGVPAAIFVILMMLYPAYAERRIAELEV